MKLSYNFKHFFIITLCVSLFSSCHKIKSHKNDELNNWQQIHTWSFNGKMAINDGNNSGSGTIKWQTENNNTGAQFKAPFGRASWEINEYVDSAVLTSSNNGITTANNAQILISNELDWNFPWDKLKFWLRGFNEENELKKHQITPKTLEDNGWVISYTKWMATPIGLLPKKIKASKPPYSVKIVIYNWEIN